MHYGISCAIFKAIIIAKGLTRFWVAIIINLLFHVLKAVVGNTTFQAGLETDTALPKDILILACLTVTVICSISLDLPRFRLQKCESEEKLLMFSSFLLHGTYG